MIVKQTAKRFIVKDVSPRTNFSAYQEVRRLLFGFRYLRDASAGRHDGSNQRRLAPRRIERWA